MLKMIRIKTIVLAGLTQLVLTNAWAAQPVCNALADCKELREQIYARIKELQAGPIEERIKKLKAAGKWPNFLDIAKDSDGKVKYMDKFAAKKHCEDQGAHLPTARELAALSISFGSKGIIDSCGSDLQCNEIRSFSRYRTKGEDNFFFSYSGYQRPAGEWGNHWFWSESAFTPSPTSSFLVSGVFGEVRLGANIEIAAVVCVAGRLEKIPDWP